MAFSLGEAVRDVFTELGQLNEGVATGGSTATVVDSGLGGGDDDWNGGTVVITRDSAGLGAAPEGEFAVVTDYATSGGTITCATGAFSVAPAAGDTYGVTTSYYPLRQVLRAINRALTSLGDIPQVDTTTLDTASGQTEYAASVAWKRRPPFRVDVQGVNSTNDNRWKEIYDWEYVPATAGSAGKIIFRSQLVSGMDIRVWYADRHATVNACSDVIYEGFHPELVIWSALYHVLIWQRGRSGGTDSSIAEMLNKCEQMLGKLETLYPVWYPTRKPRLMIVGNWPTSGSTSSKTGDSR